MKATIALFVIAGVINNVIGQSKAQRIDELFSYYCENGMFNGVVLVAEKGSISYHKAFGFSDFENKIPLDTSSVFSLASITKSYTATAILMLGEKGKLSLNDKLSKYFPKFPDYADQISLEHLLTHTSGIIDYLSRGLRLQHKVQVITNQIVIDSLQAQEKLTFKPGEKCAYSNSNYLILAQIVEKVSGKTFSEFLSENIFIPIGMKHTMVQDELSGKIQNRVNAYDAYWEINEEDLRFQEYGAQSIYSTAYDQYLFDQALYTEKLISQESVNNALDTTGLLDRRKYVYGYGWKISLETDNTVAFHNGAIGGFRSHFWRSPDTNETLIILCNDTWLSYSPDLISGAENIMQGRPYELGKKSAAIVFYESWYMNGFQAAMTSLKKAMNLNPPEYTLEPWEIHYFGQSLFLENGNLSEAIEIFEYSTELFPEGPVLWETLGEAYLANTQKGKAIICFEKVLELRPNHGVAREMLDKLKN